MTLNSLSLDYLPLAYIPSPTVSQFSIGSLTIHFYALCILAGVIAAVWIGTARWKKLGGNFDQILDMFCPEAWKQRAFDGSPALTGYDPPSALISPANGDAVEYLSRVAEAFVGIAEEAGLRWPWVNKGE